MQKKLWNSLYQGALQEGSQRVLFMMSKRKKGKEMGRKKEATKTKEGQRGVDGKGEEEERRKETEKA